MLEKSVLAQFYWAYISPYCLVEDSGATVLKRHHKTLGLERYISIFLFFSFSFYVIDNGKSIKPNNPSIPSKSTRHNMV